MEIGKNYTRLILSPHQILLDNYAPLMTVLDVSVGHSPPLKQEQSPLWEYGKKLLKI